MSSQFCLIVKRLFSASSHLLFYPELCLIITKNGQGVLTQGLHIVLLYLAFLGFSGISMTQSGLAQLSMRITAVLFFFAAFKDIQ